jgi:hypothetical protein
MTIKDIWTKIWERWTYNEYTDEFPVYFVNDDSEILDQFGKLYDDSQTEKRDCEKRFNGSDTCYITLMINEISEGDEYPDFIITVGVDIEY